jgi:hypothetical protein
VSANWVLRETLPPARDKVKGGRRKLHSEELHNLNSSTDIIRTMKGKMMIWVEHVERTGKIKMHTKFRLEIINKG